MADPEIGLASSTTLAHNEHDKGGVLDDKPRHESNSPARSSSDPWNTLDEDSNRIEKTLPLEHSIFNSQGPIDYHYLSWDTDVSQLADTPLYRSEGLRLFSPPDPAKYEDPMKWSPSRKRVTLALSCIATIFTAFTAGAYSPGAAQMSAEWHVSTTAVLVGITTFTCGFAVAPMVLAPFSEVNGRRPVFIATGLLFVICQACCGLTRSYGGMLAARFFVGVGGSTFSTMVGGVVSDMYATEERNTPMALFSGAAILGTGLGPLICSFIAQKTTWRWMFWLQTIVDGVLMLFIIAFFRETRSSVLLSRKAKTLNEWYASLEAAGSKETSIQGSFDSQGSGKHPQKIRWIVAADEERASLSKLITLSLYRPFRLLFTEPVVFCFSIWLSFSWAVLYMSLAAVPLIYSRNYNFDLVQSGAIFSAICVVAILMTILSIWPDRAARRSNIIKKERWLLPESRLYSACIESPLLPIGLFMFGWTAAAGNSVHWIVPTIAIAFANAGIFSIYLSSFNYLADSYGAYASSALAAQSFCRNMLGGAFPLVTDPLFLNLGFGAAGSLLGAIAIVLCLVPWVLVIWGPQIRARSKFAQKQLAAAE